MSMKKEKQPEKFSIKFIELSGSQIYISRTGYTGEDGFEIVMENHNAAKLWSELLEKGQKYEVKPIGLGARDTLRLEASMLLYGQDMDENITPIEASLAWSVSKDKQEDYYGKEIIQSQLKNGTDKILIGFKMLDKSIPRHNCEIFKNNEKIGEVTSGGVGPSIGANIGLGYVIREFSKIDTKLDIKIRDKFHPAEITKRPFYAARRALGVQV
jgi:aminomethyltransferase